MKVSTTRLFCSVIGVLGVISLFSMSTVEMNAAPRGGGSGFRPSMPMHTPATGSLPAGVRPGTMPHGTIMQPSQMGNSAIQANSANTMFNSRMAVNTGFNGFGNFNGFGRMSNFASGLGAFNMGLATSSFSGLATSSFSGIRGAGMNGFSSGFSGFSSPFLNGFNNLNGFNSFAPQSSGFGNTKLGFNGANGL